MNYVCTFIDNNQIDNVLNVWLPSLQKYFSGQIVVIAFNLKQDDITLLKNKGVVVIQKKQIKTGLKNIVPIRLSLQKKYIHTLKENDKIMLVDGGDVVFQDNIDNFFNNIDDRVFYSTTGTKTNETTLKWADKAFKDSIQRNTFKNLIVNKEIKAVGMLAGKKQSMLRFLNRHKRTIKKLNIEPFVGLNQIVLTDLIIRYPKDFCKTDIHNCRLLEDNIIYKDGIFKVEKTIPIVHFSCPKMKALYKKLYLPNDTPINNLKILWLYGSTPKWDEINHWYHLDFAEVIKKQPNVDLLVYGYGLHEQRPQLAKIPYNEKITSSDIKKEFDFDVIIMDNKNRFFKDPSKRESCWLNPSFFNTPNIPVIMMEGDYHLHFKHPEEEEWYRNRKVDLLLVRHLSSLTYHNDKSLPIKFFPCSVDTNIFCPNPDIERIQKVFLIGGYGANYYIYRNMVGNILKGTNLLEMNRGRILGDDYPKCLQSYVSHVSGSSTRFITASKMFEIMASGSVLFTDEGDEYGLKDLFPLESYVPYKRDGSNVESQARKILYDLPFRNTIVENGLKTIHEKHSHVVRAYELFDIIKEQFKISFETNKVSPVTTFKNIITLSKKDLLTSLLNKKYAVCLLEETCKDFVVDKKIENLHIAIKGWSDLKEIEFLKSQGVKISAFPSKTKLLNFFDTNLKIHVPFPVVQYLIKCYGDKIRSKIK